MSGLNEIVPELKPIQFRFEHHFELLHPESILGEYEAFNSISYPFTVPDYGNEEWFLSLGISRFDQRSLYLIHQEEPKKFLIDLMFEIRNYLSPESRFVKQHSGPLSTKNGFDSFIQIDDTIRLANPDNGLLHVICEFKLTPLPPKTIEPPLKIPECDLVHHIGLLYNDEATADFTLTINEKKFHAHKVILTARSSHFATMFKGDWKETIAKEVDPTDMDANILEQVLRFIYTDQIPDLNELNAMHFLKAADRFDLQKLKIMCEKTLYENINVKNAAEILVKADWYEAHQLKTKAWKFIERHQKGIINTDVHKYLKEHLNDRELLAELELFD